MEDNKHRRIERETQSRNPLISDRGGVDANLEAWADRILRAGDRKKAKERKHNKHNV